MGVPGFIPGVLDFSLWKSRGVLENKDGQENKPRMKSDINMLPLNLDKWGKNNLTVKDGASQGRRRMAKKSTQTKRE